MKMNLHRRFEIEGFEEFLNMPCIICKRKTRHRLIKVNLKNSRYKYKCLRCRVIDVNPVKIKLRSLSRRLIQ